MFQFNYFCFKQAGSLNIKLSSKWGCDQSNQFHTGSAVYKTQAGRYKVSMRQNVPLTYEEAHPPHDINVRKGFNSINTSNLEGGLRCNEMIVEDLFIRKFLAGTWHRLFLSKVIIKRRANAIFISGIIHQSLLQRKLYFLIGYTEQILSYVLKCPVKMELQSTADRKALIVKYV